MGETLRVRNRGPTLTSLESHSIPGPTPTPAPVVRAAQFNSVHGRSVPFLAQLIDERGIVNILRFEFGNSGISFSFDIKDKLDRRAVGDEGLAQPRQDYSTMILAQKCRVVDLGISCQDFQRRVFVGEHKSYGVKVGFDDALDDAGALANIRSRRRQTHQREQQLVRVNNHRLKGGGIA